MMLLAVLSALLIAGLLVGGMLMWWLAGRALPRPGHPSRHPRDTQAALRRHPAGRERWLEPDGLPALNPPDGPGPRKATGRMTTPNSSARWSGLSGWDPGALD
jgi:hypothetical protein